MKYIDEFRDPDAARRLLARIEEQVAELQPTRSIKLMEVCGGHTHSIFRYGLENLLPEAVELVHGPGCPVCVLPLGRVDDAVAIAMTPGVIFATYGDALRVPGSKMSLQQAKA
ncbi:MAG: hydrogenase formation protein HypD, partial [Myxococcota bacterium]